ncbi:uncharacterized protein LOC122081450 [Macadamia integrifolia]|uniref:uncharacterized protein LOC122081450 n=1 Tax=Macadamia integrifolia TaxID=60698 RepID=UPI001C4EA7DC|nr:uncharacterized protein LOC122081450 [Macadamia integrifolia]
MNSVQAMKRIPRIKFPPRHRNSSGSASQPDAASKAGDVQTTLFSRSEVPGTPDNTSVGGKASAQPKRTPVTDREIEAILLGGCI